MGLIKTILVEEALEEMNVRKDRLNYINKVIENIGFPTYFCIE